MQDLNNANPSGGAIVWQPVFMAPAKTAMAGKNLTSIRVFSIASIILGILSIGLQIAALVIYATEIYNYIYYPFDVVGHGIWCGCFYVTAGSLGVDASKKKTTSLLVGTVVMSSLSVAGSIVASTLSGITAGYGVSYNCYYYLYNSSWGNDDDLCDTWLGLEWSLVTVSILAFCSTLTLLTVASVPLCCGKRNQGSERNTVTVGIGNNQQPIYFQPQPMYAAAQQQQQPNHQFAYAGQQTQYPQQILYPKLMQQPQSLQPTPYSQTAPQQQQPQFMQEAPVVHTEPALQATVVHQKKSQQSQDSKPE